MDHDTDLIGEMELNNCLYPTQRHVVAEFVRRKLDEQEKHWQERMVAELQAQRDEADEVISQGYEEAYNLIQEMRDEAKRKEEERIKVVAEFVRSGELDVKTAGAAIDALMDRCNEKDALIARLQTTVEVLVQEFGGMLAEPDEECTCGPNEGCNLCSKKAEVADLCYVSRIYAEATLASCDCGPHEKCNLCSNKMREHPSCHNHDWSQPVFDFGHGGVPSTDPVFTSDGVDEVVCGVPSPEVVAETKRFIEECKNRPEYRRESEEADRVLSQRFPVESVEIVAKTRKLKADWHYEVQ